MIVGFLFSGDAFGQEGCFLQSFRQSDPMTLEFLGSAVALEGETLFVGASGDELDGYAVGSVSVYDRSAAGWVLGQLLLAGDNTILPFDFGDALAVGGSLLVVGAPGEFDNQQSNTDRGAAYVFELQSGSWVQTGKLLAADGASGDRNGSAVATDGTCVVSGALSKDGSSPDEGKVYVYRKVGSVWTEVQDLTAPTPSFTENFGGALAFANGDLVVGATGTLASTGNDSGSIYVFHDDGTGFSFVQQIFPLDPTVADGFGASIAAEGDLMVVGDPCDDTFTGRGGAAYVLRQQTDGTWSQIQKLYPGVSAFFGEFGTRVAITDRTILASAPGAGSMSQGQVHVLEETTPGVWAETRVLLAPGGSNADALGRSLAADGPLVAAGAPYADLDTTTTQIGEADLWSLDGTDCPTLSGTPESVSLSAGGTQLLTLDADDSLANALYWVVGSLSGTLPGFPLGGAIVPVNPDAYFLATLGPNLPPLSSNVGTLSATALARVQVVVPALSDPSLVGSTLEHAAVVFRLGPFTVCHVSNPAPLSLDM